MVCSKEESKFAIICDFDHDYWTLEISLPYLSIYPNYYEVANWNGVQISAEKKEAVFLIGGAYSSEYMEF